MKKSIIWLLTIVMALTFGALLYFQIMYLENMVKMREGQFSEGVMRALYSTADFLERQETLHYLEEDATMMQGAGNPYYTFTFEAPTGGGLTYPSPTMSVSGRYKDIQDVIRSQYLYQQELLNEVILTIMRDSGKRPVAERADSTLIRDHLSSELRNNGLQVPFAFSISDKKGRMIYSTDDYDPEAEKKEVYSQPLFPHSENSYFLNVEFPTKRNYIFSSVRFIIPTLSFTLILLVIFLYTIILAFRQKRLTEMKTDFINNMTHELKTPISTISLAGQMLSDPSVRKSNGMLEHLAGVITEESKRLRFQVEKVLQMSVLDKSTSAALKISTVDADKVIASAVNNFKIKVEKFGGELTCRLDAENSDVRVDEMHFTNVIYNLLDNAVKYMREDIAPQLEISTHNISGNRLEIRVTDNGIGIKKDDLKRIFDKFYRVSTGNIHDVKGFGLGLAYVKKMVEMFGGNIRVESDLGVGTTFIIDLPLAAKPEEEDSGVGASN